MREGKKEHMSKNRSWVWLIFYNANHIVYLGGKYNEC